MRQILSIVAFFMSMSLAGFSQTFEPVKAAAALKAQAAAAGEAFVKKDYKTFCRYTYPKLITMMGGQQKMITTLQQALAKMKEQGVELQTYSLGEPGKAYRSGGTWQSTIPQHLKLKIPNGFITTTSTLIAFSSDNGKSWTFLDTSNKDMATIKGMVPDLSPSISIPPPQQPVRSAN